MMKKLLVLMLVLGMVSMATAGLSWVDGATATVNQGDVINLILSGNTTTGGYWLDLTAVDGSVSVTALANAGGNATVTLYTTGSYSGYAFVEASDTLEPFTNAIGNQFNVAVDSSGLALGDYILGADTLGGNAQYLTLSVVVPEPISMSLLAVGGLFLRRRK
jgi:hypothetical protein